MVHEDESLYALLCGVCVRSENRGHNSEMSRQQTETELAEEEMHCFFVLLVIVI